MSDLHVRPFNDFSRHIGLDGLTPLGKNLIETAQWLTALTLGCSESSWFINNGDYTDSPGRLDAATLFLLAKMEDVWKLLPNKILNIGNHDYSNKIGLHNLSLHASIPGYVLPAHNTVLHHSSGLYVVPFTYSVDDQVRLLRSIPAGSVVAVHTPILGAYLNPSTSDDNGVSPEEFERFALTLAGHYHTPQYLHGGSRTLFNSGVAGKYFCPSPGSVIILGTPLPHSFADTGDNYGAWVVDLESHSVIFHLNPHAPKYLNSTISSLAELGKYSANGRSLYLSLTAPQDLHKEILATGLNGITAFRLRRPLVEVPRRDKVVVSPPGEGDNTAAGLVGTLLSYLDSLGQPYDRATVAKDVAGKLSLISTPDRERCLGGRVKFIQMCIENFLSYERAEIEFGNPGFWLVSGVNMDTETGEGNGAGKSSLIEALVWCLYGDLLREAPSKDSLVRRGEDRCKVEIEFEANGETYRVMRTRNRSTSKTLVTLLLRTNGTWVNISAGSVAESNKQIVHTLGITQEDFILTSIFAPYLDSSFANIKDGDKKQFLSRVYELDIFDEILGKYKDMLQGASRSISSLEGSLLAQEEQLAKTREVYERRRASAENEAQMRKEQISSAEMLLASTSLSRDLVSAEERNKKQLLATLQEDLRKKTGIEVRLEGVRSRLQRSEQRILVARTALLSPPSSCASCGQPLTEAARQEYARGLEAARDKAILEHRSVLEEKGVLENQLALIPVDIDIAQLAPLSGSVGDLEEARGALSDSISSLSGKINLLRSLPDPAESIKELEEALAASSRMIEGARSELGKLQVERDLFSLLVSALGPRGVVSYVLDRAIVQLNSYLEHVSCTLYGKDYSVWLASTKELKDGRDANIITLQYSTPGGSFGLSSGGEKGKARIALFMAINYLLTAQGRGTTNLIMLDEALDSLDAKAASSTVESLRRFVDEEGKTCFLISHSEGVKSLIDRQIIVERCNEVSRIIHNGSIRDSHPQRV